MEDYQKKYEEAMLRMNKWVEGSEIIDPKEVAEFVFPELKESEDKVMKELILNVLLATTPQLEEILSIYKKHRKDVIAWLEKQGEHKPVWSEEDEKILQALINDTEKTLFVIKQEERPDIMSGLSEIYIERLRWLKSLKERMKGE